MSERTVDLVIVGGGPAGLSAAVNAAYEGIDTLVLDGKNRFGGQAGQATWIENYAGFQDGITGYDLTNQMLDQGVRLGARYQAPLEASRITLLDDGTFEIKDHPDSIVGHSVLLACGVDYRRHNAPNLAVFLGRGVTYGTPHKSAVYENQRLVVVGGANSAGQAALSLSRMTGCEIDLLVRGDDLRAKMSASVAEKIEDHDNIIVHLETEIIEARGEHGRLTEVVVKTPADEYPMPADEVFLLIGATPRTDWLPDEVAKDELGFVCAGRQLDQPLRDRFEEECGRAPMDRETSVPGLFVVGDVRSGSVKRVASATGDGSIVVPEIYHHINS
jgi:thioredoxin reductase (NADPH)